MSKSTNEKAEIKQAPLQKESTQKQTRISQGRCPLVSLEDALRIPQAIRQELAGQADVPMMVAKACGISPTSSHWRVLSSAAVAYGLTTGAYNAKEIGLTPLGSRAVSPLKEGDDTVAIKQAALIPTLFNELAQKYDQNKLPREDIAQNLLLSMGIPKDRIGSAWAIFRENAKFAGFLQVISGNEFLYTNTPTSTEAANLDAGAQETPAPASGDADLDLPADVLNKLHITPPDVTTDTPPEPRSLPIIPSIFIAHGKNSQTIVGQLKELISYGQMKPVVSVERETPAIPVPMKVFDDMRACDAAIIHLDMDILTLVGGTTRTHINENVLIEIGAAMALYQDRVILLCQKGTALPSNLQGLYYCEYDGNQLDYTSTIKLLKAMQEIRQKIS